MKKILVFSLFSVAILLTVIFLPKYSDSSTTGNGDVIFSGVQIHSINIQFFYPNYWDSLIYYYNQGLEQYIPANVTANGVTYNNVGIRLKGNSSFTHPNNKKSIRLSFDEYVSGQKWDGLKGIHLNNCWNDPTFIREKMHLDLCRAAGIPAPRGNFAKVYFNDTLFAFYSMVEHVDKTFLTSRYGTNTGTYFKAVDSRDTGVHVYSDFSWLGSDTALYLDKYELKSDDPGTAWRKLVTFIDTLNNSPVTATALPNKCNVNAYYKAMSADILFGNTDSYVGTGRNFYIYFNPSNSQKLDWIVWDASLSFGANPAGGVSNIENMSVTYMSSYPPHPLFEKVINTPSLKSQYLQTFCVFYKTYFTAERLFPYIDSVANIIRSSVYADPRKMYTNQQFETNLISDITVAGSRKPGLKSFITLRSANVQTQLINLGVYCESGINFENNYVTGYELKQNYPNPFNPSTNIRFVVPKNVSVTLKVYDISGKEISTLINNEKYQAGSYSVEWDGKDFKGNCIPSGIYFYKISTPDYENSRKMILIK